MIGLGMGLPVLLLSYFPALLRKLPKPGAWMETFKQVLAFPLYATVAWLTWVLGAQAGNDAVLALLAGLVLIALGAWLRARRVRDRLWRPTLAAIFVAVGIFVARRRRAPRASTRRRWRRTSRGQLGAGEGAASSSHREGPCSWTSPRRGA